VSLTPWRILNAVARANDVSPSLLIGPFRSKELVRARWQAMWLLRELLDMSLPAIGRAVHRDHSTVLYGLRNLTEPPLALFRELSGFGS
jgi:chromosomal replication initiation ATPase DnaA